MTASAPATTRRGAVPPGPRGHLLLGNGPALAQDPLALYTSVRRAYGDVVRLRAMPPFSWYQVTHPRDIEHILVHNQKNYHKGSFFRRALVPLLGNGLFTNEGDSWLAQRRLIQPTFHRGNVTALADTIVGPTEAMLGRWAPLAASGQPVDVLEEMTRLTLQIAGLSLFGVDLLGAARAIGAASRVVFEDASYRLNSPFALPAWVPTPRNRRFLQARRVLDRAVLGIIAQRRREQVERHDLLASLMGVRDESGVGMTDEQLRDEGITLMLAGHETTAAALSWTWYLLSEHPVAAERLHAELDGVLGGRPPTVDDLANLPYCQMVIDEALRLYPPAWGVPRQALAEDEIGGFRLPAGAVIAIGTFVTHRHPDYWEQPEQFDPDRFSHERSAGRPRFAYFPFGGGARQCVGASLALLESRLVVAMVAQRFRPRLVPGTRVVPDPTFTLRPRGSLPMTLIAR